MSVIHLSKDNFEEEVLKSDVPVLVDFWATWCGPCRMLAPTIEELSNELTDVKVCKLDVDDNPELSEKYGIMNIPCLMVFKGGDVVKTAIGVQPKETLKEMVLSV
ncbi:MAG: thioredoxin [Saccharofermentans sp.]|nr:thioredoxin [Saccharofermentans sp.]